MKWIMFVHRKHEERMQLVSDADAKAKEKKMVFTFFNIS